MAKSSAKSKPSRKPKSGPKPSVEPEPKARRPHMPGYGLPKTEKGLLPWKWADDRLRKNHNFWIATVHPDGRPHVMVIWALWLGGAIYFSTGSQSRKAKNLNEFFVDSTEPGRLTCAKSRAAAFN